MKREARKPRAREARARACFEARVVSLLNPRNVYQNIFQKADPLVPWGVNSFDVTFLASGAIWVRTLDNWCGTYVLTWTFSSNTLMRERRFDFHDIYFKKFDQNDHFAK